MRAFSIGWPLCAALLLCSAQPGFAACSAALNIMATGSFVDSPPVVDDPLRVIGCDDPLADSRRLDGVNFYGARVFASASAQVKPSVGLHVFASARLFDSTLPFSSPYDVTAFSSARVVYDDFVFEKNGTAQPSTINGNLNLIVHGDLSAPDPSTAANFDAVASDRIVVVVDATRNGVSVVPVGERQSVAIRGVERIGGQDRDFSTSTGAFQGQDLSAHDFGFSVPFLNIPLDVPISLDLTVWAAAQVSGTTLMPHGGSATADFENTISFPTDTPVFDLPDGYTVSSASAFIVDNRFVPPPVPEPATWTLVLAGACCLAFALKAPRMA